MMRRGAILLASFLYSCTPGEQSQKSEQKVYDDPAVAICEVQLKEKDVPTGADYKRLGATITGRVVVINYEYSLLNTRPIEGQKSCEFVVNKFGDFIVKSPPPTDRFESADAIKARLAAMIAESKKLQATGIYPIKRERTELKPD